MIDGTEIGTKTAHGKSIILDDLMSNHYLDIYPNASGILIPSTEILKRRQFEWFSRMSVKQVLQSDTIIGNYMLVNIGETSNILEPLTQQTNQEIQNKFVGFWRTPEYPGLYGLKPNFLGDNLIKQKYTSR
jgi:hypothetical protein